MEELKLDLETLNLLNEIRKELHTLNERNKPAELSYHEIMQGYPDRPIADNDHFADAPKYCATSLKEALDSIKTKPIIVEQDRIITEEEYNDFAFIKDIIKNSDMNFVENYNIRRDGNASYVRIFTETSKNNFNRLKALQNKWKGENN